MVTTHYFSFLIDRYPVADAGLDAGYYEDKLINDILNERGHNQYGRPVEDESAALEVKFGVSLQQIIEVVGINNTRG